MVSRAEIEVAAATYLVYYGNHIAAEEEDILPLAAKTLTEADWAAARDAAPAGKDPLLGREPQARFRDLRRRIAVEA
jgi:hemerythrin-like domain-containing protein